jgi:hypothetical protein
MARRVDERHHGEERAPRALVLDLVEWIAREPRLYADVMAAWRTSCPRLPVWEEALAQGLVARDVVAGRAPAVVVTAAGREFLAAHGRHSVLEIRVNRRPRIGAVEPGCEW